MTDSSALVAFIRERLDEDERIAKAAAPGPWRVDDERYVEVIYAADDTSVVAGGRWGGEASVFSTDEDAIHIARHDPARVLREVEAKRRIVRMAEMYADAQFPDHDGGYADAAEEAVVLLAAVWSDHPDYREEWRP